MNAQRIFSISAYIYMGLSILSLGYVAILSLFSPQATMDMVATPLPNTDAISSIRGIYGGVGLVISIALVYLAMTDLRKGLAFLTLFWFSYAISRMITIGVDGPLGDFGNQWLVIELVFGVLALGLWWLNGRGARPGALA